MYFQQIEWPFYACSPGFMSIIHFNQPIISYYFSALLRITAVIFAGKYCELERNKKGVNFLWNTNWNGKGKFCSFCEALKVEVKCTTVICCCNQIIFIRAASCRNVRLQIKLLKFILGL